MAGNGRVLAKDTDICGFKMPRGTPVVSFNYGIHRNPEFWENPEVIELSCICIQLHLSLNNAYNMI